MTNRLLILGLIMITFAVSQTVSGKVTDAETNEPLIGANVFVEGTLIGTATDLDGSYTLRLDHGTYTIVVDYIGYVQKKMRIDVSDNRTANFEMKEDIFSQEVTVTAQRAKQRETPVAVTTIDIEKIEAKVAGRDITTVLTAVPGVHVTDQGGASGDSRITIRGFAQENISVMINGVPVNDMESRRVYWSNWSALSDITKSVQTQRGLGASTLSTSSVGGILNMIVKSSDAEAGLKFRQDIGSDGMFKESLVYNTGLINDSFALSAMVGRKDFEGYADVTSSEEWLWFFGGSFFTGAHSFHLSAYGTPQERDRRSYKQTLDKWSAYGKLYNPNVGYTDKDKKNLINTAKNKYHKPTLNINHIWDISTDIAWENVIYGSWGRGYGTSLFGNSGSAPLDAETGYTDFYSLIESNKLATGAQNKRVIVSSNNDHNWYGFTSTINFKMKNHNFVAGVDGRMYEGLHYRKIENMFGLSAFDEVNQTNSRSANPNAVKGDIVHFNYRGYVDQAGVFFQDEINFSDKLHLFGNISYAAVKYDFQDLYNGVSRANTPNVYFHPLTVKTGVNYNIDSKHNVYMNIGRLQQAPLHRNVYGNNTFTDLKSNYLYDSTTGKVLKDENNNKIMVNPSKRSVSVTEGAKVETVKSIEFGYGYTSDWLALNANAYYTRWIDKSIVVSQRLLDESTASFNVTGLHAVHKGIEIEGKMKPVSNIELRTSISLQDNTWRNNAGYERSDETSGETQRGIFFLENLKVGYSPQTTFLGAIKYNTKLNNELSGYIELEMKNNRDYYGGFNVDDLDYLTSEGTPFQASRIPTYTESTLSFQLKYTPQSSDMFKAIKLNVNVFNLMDEDYISDGSLRNGQFEIFYGRPRHFSTSLTFEF